MPDKPLSPLQQIEQMEAQDEANGTIDGRNAPYVVMEVVALDHQIFLPLMARGALDGAAAPSVADRQSAWNAMARASEEPSRSRLAAKEQAEPEPATPRRKRMCVAL
ncbi:MAG: hypothetical protein IAE81_14845 [Caldilineaceae bacterium]|nr:hypothetical protein [Caldilineaceae bacterium]